MNTFFSKLKEIAKSLTTVVSPPENLTVDNDRQLYDDDGEATDVFRLCEVDPAKFAADLKKDEGRWWYHQGHVIPNVPDLDALDADSVCQELEKKIANNEFPVIEIPDNVMRTLDLLNNPDFDFAEVANLINRSPAMAGEFIRVTNSSLYSRGVEVRDLRVALPRLGKDNVKAMLFMYSSKLSVADNPQFNDLAIKIVDHSYSTALIASYLSQRYFPDPDTAFLAGLLHDIGKLGILKAISEDYKIPEDLDFEILEVALERLFPGIHEKAGKFLGENWKLDETVLSAIEHHHDFRDATFFEEDQVALHLSCLINISDTMARMLGKGRPIERKVHIFGEPACVELNMDKSTDSIRFLEDIPKVVAFKTSQEAQKITNEGGEVKKQNDKR